MREFFEEHYNTLFYFKKTFNSIKKDFNPFKFKNLFSILMSCIIILSEVSLLLFICYEGYEIFKLFNSDSNIKIPMPTTLRYLLLGFITFFFLVPLFFLVSEYFEKYGYKIFRKLTIENNPIIFFILGFIFIGILSNRIQYLNIIHGYSNKEISFIYSETKIKTNKELVYIGSTKDYIFLRNNNDSLSMIFKKDEIRNLTIKKISEKEKIKK